MSCIWVLKPTRNFSSRWLYLGRAAHKIVLGFISKLDADLATEMHDMNGPLPFTISDIFENDSTYHQIRVTALREDIIEAINALEDCIGTHFDGWQLCRIISDHFEWCGETSVEQILAQSWQPQPRIRLKFKTQTAIKSRGLIRPFPMPELVFKSLFERWQHLTDTPLPYTPPLDVLETFLLRSVSIRHFIMIVTRDVPMKREGIPGFMGDVWYQVERPTDVLRKMADKGDEAAQIAIKKRRDLRCVLNVLTAFSFYSGVGIKTAQGMGMTRPVEDWSFNATLQVER